MSKEYRNSVTQSHVDQMASRHDKAVLDEIEEGAASQDLQNAAQVLNALEPVSLDGTLARDDFRSEHDDIAPSQIHEVAERLSISPEELRTFIQKVGANLAAVKKHLQETKPSQ